MRLFIVLLLFPLVAAAAPRPVTVLTIETGTLVPLRVAVGVSKVQGVPSCTVLLVLRLQSMTGAVVSMTVTV